MSSIFEFSISKLGYMEMFMKIRDCFDYLRDEDGEKDES